MGMRVFRGRPDMPKEQQHNFYPHIEKAHGEYPKRIRGWASWEIHYWLHEHQVPLNMRFPHGKDEHD